MPRIFKDLVKNVFLIFQQRCLLERNGSFARLAKLARSLVSRTGGYFGSQWGLHSSRGCQQQPWGCPQEAQVGFGSCLGSADSWVVRSLWGFHWSTSKNWYSRSCEGKEIPFESFLFFFEENFGNLISVLLLYSWGPSKSKRAASCKIVVEENAFIFPKFAFCLELIITLFMFWTF